MKVKRSHDTKTNEREILKSGGGPLRIRDLLLLYLTYGWCGGLSDLEFVE
jgi:hypothetical protein